MSDTEMYTYTIMILIQPKLYLCLKRFYNEILYYLTNVYTNRKAIDFMVKYYKHSRFVIYFISIYNLYIKIF